MGLCALVQRYQKNAHVCAQRTCATTDRVMFAIAQRAPCYRIESLHRGLHDRSYTIGSTCLDPADSYPKQVVATGCKLSETQSGVSRVRVKEKRVTVT
jgi:hypothetical protein